MAETNGLRLLTDAVKISGSADENSQVASNQLRVRSETNGLRLLIDAVKISESADERVRLYAKHQISYFRNNLVGLMHVKYQNEEQVMFELGELCRTMSDKQIRKYQELLYRELLHKYR
jgi:hypothetical protein